MSAMERFFDCDGVLEELLELAQSALVPGYGRSLIELERSATRLEVFTSSVVPGLLQTADYARELLRRSLPGKSDDELDDLVLFRLKRHRIFQREGDPLYYWAVIDEAALKRPIGGEETMAAQLRHLLERAAHPLVTVQVLPFSRGAHPVLGGSLILYSLSDGSTVAGIESFGDARIVDAVRAGGLPQPTVRHGPVVVAHRGRLPRPDPHLSEGLRAMSAAPIPHASSLSGWRKSSYSENGQGACIEVVDGHPAGIPVRDSKDPHGPALLFPASAWSSFVEAVKSHHFPT